MLSTKLALMLLVGCGQVSATTDARVASKQIQAVYDQWSKAYMALDVDVLMSILADDYVLTSFTKDKLTRKEYEAYLRLKKQRAVPDLTKTRTKVDKVKLSGNLAEVRATETMSSEVLDPGTQKRALSVHRHIYKDVWRWSGESWKLASTETIKETTELKPIR